MKLTIFDNDKELELYLVRMQSRVPKWTLAHASHERRQAGLRKAISIRVMAKSARQAENLALKRKHTMSRTPAFRVLSCRKFYA